MDVGAIRAAWGAVTFDSFKKLHQRIEELEAGATVESGPCSTCADKDTEIAELKRQIEALVDERSILQSELEALDN